MSGARAWREGVCRVIRQQWARAWCEGWAIGCERVVSNAWQQ